MVSHWSLSDSKSPQVPRILLSILAYLNARVWMVSTRPLISSPPVSLQVILWLYCGRQLQLVEPSLSCSSLFFFSSLAKYRYLNFFSLSISFTLWSARTAKSINRQVLLFFFFFFFLLIISMSGRLVEFVSQNARVICASHSLELCI